MSAQAGFVPHVTTLGEGPRRVLALHCTLAFGGAWAGVAKLVGQEVTLVAPDMPSHGRSVDWDEASDFSQTVFEASMACLDDGPMDVIGHSFGAATALRMAAEYPDRIRSLMLIEPVFFVVAKRDAPDMLADHDARAAPFFEAMETGDRTLAARTFNRMWSTSGTWDAMPERSRAAMIRAIHVVPDTHDFLYEDAFGLLEPDVLEAVDAPAVLMRGEQALPAITATNAGLVRRLGNATEAVIEGAGHMAPISHPEPVAVELQKLWEAS